MYRICKSGIRSLKFVASVMIAIFLTANLSPAMGFDNAGTLNRGVEEGKKILEEYVDETYVEAFRVVFDEETGIPLLQEIAGVNLEKQAADSRCVTWRSTRLRSGWINANGDRDFYIHYHVPSGRASIICMTLGLAAALRAVNKPLVTRAWPTRYGWTVSINIGMTETQKICSNCLNSVLERQAVVRFRWW